MGPLIPKETKDLETVFKDEYHFDATCHLIPSRNPQSKIQRLFGNVIDDISDKVVGNKKGLLIVYYNGHGAMLDGRLIFAA